MYVYMQVKMHLCPYVEAKGTPWVSSPKGLSLTESLEPCCLCFCSPRVTAVFHHIWFSYGCWGFKFRPSCLCGRHSTQQPFSLYSLCSWSVCHYHQQSPPSTSGPMASPKNFIQLVPGYLVENLHFSLSICCIVFFMESVGSPAAALSVFGLSHFSGVSSLETHLPQCFACPRLGFLLLASQKCCVAPWAALKESKQLEVIQKEMETSFSTLSSTLPWCLRLSLIDTLS